MTSVAVDTIQADDNDTDLFATFPTGPYPATRKDTTNVVTNPQYHRHNERSVMLGALIFAWFLCFIIFVHQVLGPRGRKRLKESQMTRSVQSYTRRFRNQDIRVQKSPTGGFHVTYRRRLMDRLRYYWARAFPSKAPPQTTRLLTLKPNHHRHSPQGTHNYDSCSTFPDVEMSEHPIDVSESSGMEDLEQGISQESSTPSVIHPKETKSTNPTSSQKEPTIGLFSILRHHVRRPSNQSISSQTTEKTENKERRSRSGGSSSNSSRLDGSITFLNTKDIGARRPTDVLEMFEMEDGQDVELANVSTQSSDQATERESTSDPTPEQPQELEEEQENLSSTTTTTEHHVAQRSSGGSSRFEAAISFLNTVDFNFRRNNASTQDNSEESSSEEEDAEAIQDESTPEPAALEQQKEQEIEENKEEQVMQEKQQEQWNPFSSSQPSKDVEHGTLEATSAEVAQESTPESTLEQQQDEQEREPERQDEKREQEEEQSNPFLSSLPRPPSNSSMSFPETEHPEEHPSGVGVSGNSRFGAAISFLSFRLNNASSRDVVGEGSSSAEDDTANLEEVENKVS